jgi:hypothetical protein
MGQRWWRRRGWNQSLEVRRMVCAKSCSGRTDCPSLSGWTSWPPPSGSAAQHSTRKHNAQPRCRRGASCLRRVAIHTSATCRFAMLVPSPVASHHDPGTTHVTRDRESPSFAATARAPSLSLTLFPSPSLWGTQLYNRTRTELVLANHSHLSAVWRQHSPQHNQSSTPTSAAVLLSIPASTFASASASTHPGGAMSSNPPSAAAAKASAPAGPLSPLQSQAPSATPNFFGQQRGSSASGSSSRASPAPRNNQQSRKQNKGSKRFRQPDEDSIAESVSTIPTRPR